jgi:hypothetical protein
LNGSFRDLNRTRHHPGRALRRYRWRDHEGILTFAPLNYYSGSRTPKPCLHGSNSNGGLLLVQVIENKANIVLAMQAYFSPRSRWPGAPGLRASGLHGF